MSFKPIVLLVGDIADERLNLTDLCAQFGWTVKPVESMDDVHRAERPWVIAGFTDASYDGGRAVEEWRRRFPRALWVACCRYGSPGEWQDIDRRIAYHLVHRPFQPAEIRQGLHFIDGAIAERTFTAAAVA
jgi:hypothetical protein